MCNNLRDTTSGSSKGRIRNARSASRRDRLRNRASVSNSMVTPGWRRENSASTGVSTCAPNQSEEVIRRTPSSCCACPARRRSIASACSSMRSACPSRSMPSSVRTNPPGVRWNSACPTAASRARNRRPIVGWVSASARAAAPRVPARAIARKIRRSLHSIRYPLPVRDPMQLCMTVSHRYRYSCKFV